jgi:hypothetical protein
VPVHTLRGIFLSEPTNACADHRENRVGGVSVFVILSS